MRSVISSILRGSTRKENEPLNVICMSTHEAYQVSMSHCNAHFYLLNLPNQKTWNTSFRPLPPNMTVLRPGELDNTREYDIVLSQNRATQFGPCSQIAKSLGIPHVALEHCTPSPDYAKSYINSHRQMRGDINVFVNENSRDLWGWSPDDSHVIHHGIDSNFFKARHPYRARQALSVVNQYRQRDRECGWRLYENIKHNCPALNFLLLGDNQELSQPAKDVHELADRYASNWVFLNTSLVSSMPLSICEAMSSECIVISTSSCQIPDVVKTGWNGLLSNNPAEIVEFLHAVLEAPEDFAYLGTNARNSVKGKFGLERFVNDWNAIFQLAVNS